MKCLIIFITLLPQLVAAQKIMHELDAGNGKKVYLYDNGKWVYKLFDADPSQFASATENTALSANNTKVAKPVIKTAGKLDRRVDDFTGEIKISTPYYIGINQQPARMLKYIKDGAVTYFLSLSAIGSTLNVSEKGVIVLFTDGTKWHREDEEIDTDSHSGDGWLYSAFIRISEEDLKTFASKKINKFRLYIYDQQLSIAQQNNFLVNVNAIIQAK